MSRSTSGVRGKLLGITVAAAGLLSLTAGPVAWVFGQQAANKQEPNAPLIALGYKFEGAAGCNNAQCHGATTPKPAPKPAANEYVTWAEGKQGGEPDHHSIAYKTLTKEDSKKITKALGIAEAPTESGLCTNCHTLTVPANLQMAKFNVKEGVTCGACHGPYEKWEKPHNQEGGADGLRKAAGYAVLKAEDMPYHTGSPEHQKLLKETGLYDTRPILARAEKCTSCHLSIDAKLVEAGHPQPVFELAYFTDIEPPHWREPGGYWGTKVWAAGQVTCLKDAMTQLAARADAGASDKAIKDALDQAMGHLGVFKYLAGGASAAALEAAAKDLKAAAGDKAKLSATAKAVAAQALKMAPGVGAMKPTEGNTGALLAKLVNDATLSTDAGLHGAEQQAFAISSLFTAYVKGKGTVAGSDAINKTINDKLLAATAPDAFKPDAFAAILKELQGQMGPTLPSGAGVPDPIDVK